MKRLSSSWTLLLNLFFPMSWAVFFGCFTIAVLLVSPQRSPLLGSWIFKIGTLIFYGLGLLILKHTLLKLKRVEIDDDHLYVSNYFKSFRYANDGVESIKEQDFLLFRTAQIRLKEPGSFGQTITFMQSRHKFNHFLPTVPALFDKLVSNDRMEHSAE